MIKSIKSRLAYWYLCVVLRAEVVLIKFLDARGILLSTEFEDVVWFEATSQILEFNDCAARRLAEQIANLLYGNVENFYRRMRWFMMLNS